ncbi:hypothetical protein, conserved [Babesia bigemina]|uniref:C3H1-type domain-containing protein n=1 Tax=Babesia bigemina TaxID=5866 RepID=A0A061BTN1_BABBI|nr:hypothetical protein, conserved [Babesia bigemina]CDR71849.1 hypothetical protein, conserved [Babesia bigemina]|eukprot:XP_012770792.1 hypothetical protein, conserved [Babesia bigemina]
MEVRSLESNVWDDLNKLRNAISNLASEVDKDTMQNVLVKEALSQLSTAKGVLNGTIGPDGSIQVASDIMDSLFTKTIQTPLSIAINNIETQFGRLYNVIKAGKTGAGKEKKTMENVLTEIRDKVIDIKGSEFGAKGLVEILAKTEAYAETFKEDDSKKGFEGVVTAWIKNILENNGVIRRWLDDYVAFNKGQFDSKNDITDATQMHPKIITAIKQVLEGMTGKSGKEVTRLLQKANDPINVNRKIEVHLDAVKSGIDMFGKDLDEKLKKQKNSGGFDIDEILENIARGVKSQDVKSKYSNYTLHGVVEGTLAALSSIASQSSSQIHKLLKTCKFEKLDDTLEVTNGLLGRLYQAFTGNDPPAKNVDLAIKAVSEQVDGLNSKFSEVKKTFDIAVRNLPRAVDVYEKSAIAQIRVAARTAISKALEKFTTYYTGDMNVRAIMEQFDLAKNTLEHALELIDSQIEAAKSVPEFVKNLQGEAHELTTELRANLFDKINVIRQAVHNTSDVFDEVMKAVSDALSAASTNATTGVESLKSQLLAISNHAFDEVTRQVKTVFAEQHKADMDALHKCVETQLQAVKQIIDVDLRSGIKCLLKVMNDKSTLESWGKSLPQPAPRGEANRKTLGKTAQELKQYVDNIQVNIQYQLVCHGKPIDEMSKLSEIEKAFDKLLDYLKDDETTKHARKYLFDHQFTSLLSTLSSSLHLLSPSAFANPRHPELLDAVKKGLQGFVGEMGRVYVNGYDGGDKIKRWTHKETGDVELTADGRNGAKVFVSILTILYESVMNLGEECKSAEFQAIYTSKENNKNVLGDFLSGCGYTVSKSYNSHEGHLRNEQDCSGTFIYRTLLNKEVNGSQNVEHVKTWKQEMKKENKFTHPRDADDTKITLLDMLDYLFEKLEKYNDVCHLSTLTATRQPCSVYEMLVWLSGLPHSPVHKPKLDLTVLQVIADINKHENDAADNEGDMEITVEMGDSPSVSLATPKDTTVAAYPENVLYADIREAITHVCATAYDVLITIAGHGDAYTTYSGDYSNNSMRFYYPASGEDCLDMLLDILRRLLPTLQFLKTQCENSTSNNGWRSCKYGKEIKTAKWPCTEHSSDDSNTDPNCQPTSPLQSYLNDCLPGNIPHLLTSIGCKAKCDSCPTVKRGMPCLTPLGFRGFSGYTKTGRDLCHILTKFLGNEHVGGLFCLLPKPPKTLPEHFQFALSLVKGWVSTANITKHVKNKFSFQTRFQSSFETSIEKLSVELCKSPSVLTNALASAYGSESGVHLSCQDNHIVNLTSHEICINDSKDVRCAPYLTALCKDTYHYLVHNHTDLYVSWSVYLPWDFWNCLNNFYKDLCDIFCQDWGCQKCLRGDICKKGSHASVDEKSGIPHCRCQSIVSCKGVSPTLYRYGFAFADASSLTKSKFEKKCSDFCKHLYDILHSQYFKNVFKICDEFIFTIRQPFIWLNVAFWLLSFLYLLHIMVIRLDLLHIKSHLHSPSSHRIAAQSLLAAGRVNKLNRVFYLQP